MLHIIYLKKIREERKILTINKARDNLIVKGVHNSANIKLKK